MLRWPSFPVRTTKKGGHYTLARLLDTDYGHTERAFFQKFKIFWLGQTNWTENLWGIWAISGQTISTILALWVPYPWESVAGPLSYKKLWFLGLKHITPKYSQNKIWAVQNLENSVRTSVFRAFPNSFTNSVLFKFLQFYKKQLNVTHIQVLCI